MNYDFTSINLIQQYDKGSDKRYEHEKKVKRDAHRMHTYIKKDADS